MSISLASLRQETAARIPGTLTSRARRAYFATADRCAEVYDELDQATDRHDRARILHELAALDGAMAGQYGTGWRTTGEDVAIVSSYRSGAILLDLLASTETTNFFPEDRERGPAAWEKAFGAALDDLASENDVRVRAELMTRLYLAAHDVLGGDVAETIARVGNSYIRIALFTKPAEQPGDDPAEMYAEARDQGQG